MKKETVRLAAGKDQRGECKTGGCMRPRVTGQKEVNRRFMELNRGRDDASHTFLSVDCGDKGTLGISPCPRIQGRGGES